jgi:hypothetical protein
MIKIKARRDREPMKVKGLRTYGSEIATERKSLSENGRSPAA